MPISQKIIDRVATISDSPEERKLVMDILQIEDKGDFRYETAYEKAIKDYIAECEKKEGNE